MEPLLGKLKFTNNTPYHISYKKGPKIPKGFTFEIEDELILSEIEIWYGGKWCLNPIFKWKTITLCTNSLFRLNKKAFPDWQ
jgi:hypothetical protein